MFPKFMLEPKSHRWVLAMTLGYHKIRRPAGVSDWKVLCLFCPWLYSLFLFLFRRLFASSEARSPLFLFKPNTYQVLCMSIEHIYMRLLQGSRGISSNPVDATLLLLLLLLLLHDSSYFTAFTHSKHLHTTSLYTQQGHSQQAFTHSRLSQPASFYTEKLLQTEAFTHRKPLRCQAKGSYTVPAAALPTANEQGSKWLWPAGLPETIK